MARDNIVMVRRAAPKRITLPNGRTFMARNRRVRREELFEYVILKRTYKVRAAPKSK